MTRWSNGSNYEITYSEHPYNAKREKLEVELNLPVSYKSSWRHAIEHLPYPPLLDHAIYSDKRTQRSPQATLLTRLCGTLLFLQHAERLLPKHITASSWFPHPASIARTIAVSNQEVHIPPPIPQTSTGAFKIILLLSSCFYPEGMLMFYCLQCALVKILGHLIVVNENSKYHCGIDIWL